MDVVKTLLYVIAGIALLGTGILLSLRYRAEGGRVRMWFKRFDRLLLVVLVSCAAAMLILTGGALGQEYVFAQLAEVGVPDLRSAPHTPYFILMYQLSGLSLMLLSCILLLRRNRAGDGQADSPT